jgi:hypothetical protein
MNGVEKSTTYQPSFNLNSWPAITGFQTFPAVQCSGTILIGFGFCSDKPGRSLRASVVFDQLIGLRLESVGFEELLCIIGDCYRPITAH